MPETNGGNERQAVLCVDRERRGEGGTQCKRWVNEVWFPRGVTLSVALFLQVNGYYHKTGPLRWTPGQTRTQATHTKPDAWSRWNMDPNGCVASLKGLGVDLSVVKQLVQLPRGKKTGGSSELEVTGLNPNPCRKHLALHRQHASAFYADLWYQNLCPEKPNRSVSST